MQCKRNVLVNYEQRPEAFFDTIITDENRWHMVNSPQCWRREISCGILGVRTLMDRLPLRLQVIYLLATLAPTVDTKHRKRCNHRWMLTWTWFRLVLIRAEELMTAPVGPYNIGFLRMVGQNYSCLMVSECVGTWSKSGLVTSYSLLRKQYRYA